MTVDRALRLLGLGSEGTRRVDVDAQGRMRADALEAALRDTTGPTIVCAQAGEVNTGAFDPIDEIARPLRGRRSLAARGRRVRVVGRGVARAAPPDTWDRARRLVGDRRTQVAERPVRQRPRVRRASGRASGGDAADCRVPRGGRKLRHATRWTGRPSSLVGLAGSPSTRRCARWDGRASPSSSRGRCARARQFATAIAELPGCEVLNDVVLNQVLFRFEDDATTDACSRRCRRAARPG